jgi:hypothetical protein
LIDLGLSLNEVCLSLGLGVSYSETSGSDSLVFSLKLPEVLIDFLVLNLRLDFEALNHAIGLLLQSHGLMLSGGLLRTSLDFESHID